MTAEDRFTEIAAVYDETHAASFDPALVGPIVDMLASLADGGPVLEFGSGTGRVVLPLAERGLVVSGIELSAAMVDEMRRKPSGDGVPVAIGDFATTRVDGVFSVVALVYNTINNLVTQEEQVACFENAARHLAPGGVFVVEVGVPKLRRLPPGSSLVAFAADDRHIGVDRYTDIPNQRFESHHHYVTDDGSVHHAAPFRYVWPAELDLMARIAGMTLVGRWEDWHRAPFTGDSERHVSVWRRAEPTSVGS